MKKLL